jgi:N-glycosylase/DNA lyase
MVRALVAEYGAPLPTDPSRHAFPTAGQLAATEERDLRRLGLGYRSAFVIQLARRVTEGTLDLEGLRQNKLTTEEVRQRLLGIKGVGEYAAASLLMLLERYDHLPVDSWARKLVSEEWHEGRPIGRQEVQEAFESWGFWKGLVYWFWDWSHQR